VKRVVLLAIAACSRRAEIATCDDDLRGLYVVDSTDGAGGERWMVLDNGATLEAYPLFHDPESPGPSAATNGGASAASAPSRVYRPPDQAPGGGASPRRTTGELEVAPRVIDLTRGPAGLTGTLRRRYMERAERCDAQLPVQITRCAGDGLELVIADPAPPLGFSPCVWPDAGPSRVVRWRRE
jgi:hypothetical protein